LEFGIASCTGFYDLQNPKFEMQIIFAITVHAIRVCPALLFIPIEWKHLATAKDADLAKYMFLCYDFDYRENWSPDEEEDEADPSFIFSTRMYNDNSQLDPELLHMAKHMKDYIDEVYFCVHARYCYTGGFDCSGRVDVVFGNDPEKMYLFELTEGERRQWK
jgi:hypothetical protein